MIALFSFLINKKNVTKLLLLPLFFIAAFSQKTWAQFPVQITPQLVVPYSLQLSSYTTGGIPKIYVTLTNADLQQPIINVRLRMTIKSQSVIIRSRDNVFYPTVSLIAGVPQRLSLNDLAPYFDLNNLDFQGLSKTQYLQQGRLPEGFYEFCFDAIEVNTRQVVSRNECAIAAITLSDPPFLNLPSNQANVPAYDPTNILLSWTPRHLSNPNAAFTTVYDFQLIELLDNGVSPDVAFRNAQPLYQTTVTTTNLLYGVAQPMLLEGKKYGWRVRARNTNIGDNVDIFRNNGYSEIFTFTYQEYCATPANLKTTILPAGEVNITWNPIAKTTSFVIEYRNRDEINSAWTKANSILPSYQIFNAVPGATYEYRIGNICKNGGSTFFSPIFTFVAPVPPPSANIASGKINWAYKLSEETADVSNDALVSKIKINDTTITINSNNTIGTTKYVLKDAVVKIYAQYSLNGGTDPRLLGVANTDSSGNFSTTINWEYARNAVAYYMEVTHPSGLFNTIQKPIMLIRSSQGYRLDMVILTAQSFQLKPSVFISNYVNGNVVTAEVLLREDIYNRYGFIKAGGLGNGNIILYNNDRYVSLTKVTNGKAFKKLFYNANDYEHYVVKVNYTNRTPAYYPLNSIVNESDANGNKKIVLAKRRVKYTVVTGVEGIITHRNIPRRDVRIEFKIKRADILTNDTTTTFYTVTDADGGYSNYDLPQLKLGATINMQIIDRTLRIAPFTDKIIVVDSSILRKNINLENKVFSVTGRLVDQNNYPIENALVKIIGTSQQTHTSPQGFYMIKSFGTDTATIQFIVDGYTPKTIRFKPTLTNEIALPNQLLTAAQWKAATEASIALRTYLTEQNLTEATADLLNIGIGNLINRYTTYFSGIDDIKGVIDLNKTIIPLSTGILSVKLKLNDVQVRGKLKIGVINDTIVAGKNYTLTLPKGRKTYTVSPFDEDEQFIPVTGEAQINANDTTFVTIIATSAYKVSGKVKEKNTPNGLDSATVSIVGLPLSTTTTRNGNYIIYVPKNNELRFRVTRKNYNAQDSIMHLQGNAIIDFELEKRPASMPEILTIAGFPVEIETQIPASNGEYRVWGKLKVDSNGVFYNNPDENKLTLKEVFVKADNTSTNATPIYDIQFEEATMQTNAFGFGIVEAVGFPQILMKGLKDSTGEVTYNRTVIGAWNLKLQLKSINRVSSAMPISLPDALLNSTDPNVAAADSVRALNGQPKFAYVYSAPDYKINALSSKQKYALIFDNPRDSANVGGDSTYVKASIGIIAKFFIKRTKCVLDEDGISLNGYLQLPKIIGAKLPDSGKVEIEKFSIDNKYKIKELTFLISKTKPLIAKIQKIEAQLTKVSLYGIGTVNTGVGFGGTVTLKKSESSGDTLTINKFSIVNTDKGVTLTADISFDANGVAIKSLVFKTPGENHIMVAYNFTKNTFVIETNGILTYDKNRNGSQPQTNGGSESGLNSAFPIEIQLFKLQSKDWSLFMAAKANIKIDVKVAKICVERLLVSIGSDMTMDQMNAYLTTPDGTEIPAVGTGGLEDQLDEATASWAIGVKGGVEFPIKEIRASLKTSFLLGNIKNKIEVRLNEIELEMEHPAFTLKAKAKIQFSGTRQGFEGEAEFKTLTRTFAATFKYFKLSATNTSPAGFELGASIKGTANVATGYLYWWAIGGGFDFNTAQQKYKVFLVGDVGPIGTPQQVSYVKNATVSILFEVKQCGAVPIIEGSGTLFLQNKNWGYATVKLDFCRTLLMVTVNSTQEVAPRVNLNVSGVLVAIKRVVNGQTKGAFFLGVNGSLNAMGGIIAGNVFLGLGIDYDNNNTNSPAEVKSMWNRIGWAARDNNGTFFNGIYISGKPNTIQNHGSYGVSMGGFDAFNFNYSFYSGGDAELFYKFNNNIFGISAKIKADAYSSLSVFGCNLTARANANVNLNGGYNGQWYMNGNANVSLQMYNNSTARYFTGCNRVSVRWTTCCCEDIPYPCWCSKWWGGYPCICWKRVCLPYPVYTFKICKSLSAGFNYSQNGGTKINFNLF